MEAAFCSVVPLLPAGPSLQEALAFYTAHMGFEVTWQSETMGGIRRDAVAFNVVKNDNQEWAQNASFSIAVTDLDAIYREYQAVPAKMGPLEVKPWGRREFHVIVPSGVCFQFYEHE
ncbi:MAG: VOC family protein [Candidatus Cybelea sp.]|jgi:catechol 2,3-dioxygenase-like lactoylglutathione lyase family enzyme